MNYIHLVALAAIAQFLLFGIMVGRARAKYGVKAPAISGHPMFERAWRVQMNTLEQLVCFLPALFLAGMYWSNVIIGFIGLVYLFGRFIYWRSYLADPSKRSLGFVLTVLPTFALVIAAFVGIIKNASF